MDPIQPDHADRTRPISGAPRFQIRRVLISYAYPVHGNVHNPTPTYRWHLLLDGRLVDQDARQRPLLTAAREPGAVQRYGDRP